MDPPNIHHSRSLSIEEGPMNDRINETKRSFAKSLLNNLNALPSDIYESMSSLKWALGLFMTGCLIDCLFLYTIVINDEKKCIRLDLPVAILAIVLRSVNDIILTIINKRAKRFVFVVLMYTVFPLPHVGHAFRLSVSLLIFMINPRLNLSESSEPGNIAAAITVYRFLPVLLWTSKAITGGKFHEWLLMFFFYTFYFSHLAGAMWYSTAIETEAACWQKACDKIHSKCAGKVSSQQFLCSAGFKADQFISDYCSRNTTKYGFGVLEDAHQSGILLDSSGGFWVRIFYGLRWGLQSLSFGQNLRAGVNVGGNIAIIVVIVLGMLLFSTLIGLLQMFLQSYTQRCEAREMKVQGIKEWQQSFQNVPERLQSETRKYIQNNWQETESVNLEEVLHILPEKTREELARELCSKLLKKVEQFESWDGEALKKICGYVKPVFYAERTRIIREGEPIDEMIFVVKGKLWTHTNRDTTAAASTSTQSHDLRKDYLEKDDFYGKELVKQIQANPQTFKLPISPVTIQAVTEVEAFVLTAYDLKEIFMSSSFHAVALYTEVPRQQ